MRRSGAGELGRRIAWAILPAAFAIFIVSSGGGIFAAGAFLVGAACMHELFAMYHGVRPVRLAGFVALLGLVLAAQLGGERQVLMVAMASVPLVFLLSIAGPPRADGATSTASISLTVLGILWIGVVVAHAILLRNAPHGAGILVAALVGTFIGDTAAYLGGRAFGRRPLAARISPNKTIEGLLIGAVFAVIATWCAGLYQDWIGHGQSLLLGLGIAIAAPLGDLFESRVKRDAGAKDSGRLLGPHGGALDRIDAGLFAIVTAYYIWSGLS